MTSYLLLLKFRTPNYGVLSTWEFYNDLDAARIALTRHQDESKRHEHPPVVNRTTLADHVILKVADVS